MLQVHKVFRNICYDVFQALKIWDDLRKVGQAGILQNDSKFRNILYFVHCQYGLFYFANLAIPITVPN